ncbi:hypothetical protein [Planktotalea sp.]|uniref:hypothetical protein n=1 Tax=Planktotalea sp. TaxID=2029877 RepID=UPI0025F85DF3|nr:hypothetical protein [Planktotalea sp.]
MLGDSFSSLIGLEGSWPASNEIEGELSAKGYVEWAASYVIAANILCSINYDQHPFYYHAGPLMNTLGIAVELTLKAMLRSQGYSDKKIRRFGHCTYELYKEASANFDEARFLNQVYLNLEHYDVPEEIVEQCKDTHEDFENLEMYFKC